MPKQKVSIKDFEEADALELELMKWRTLASVAAVVSKDRAILAKIEALGRVKPKAIAHAYKLFGEVIKASDDWWQIYVAWKCGEVKDDAKARGVFDSAMATGWGTDKLKTAIKDANARHNGHGAKRETLAEQCADWVEVWRRRAKAFRGTTGAYADQAFDDCAENLEGEPAVAAVLAKRGKAEGKK